MSENGHGKGDNALSGSGRRIGDENHLKHPDIQEESELDQQYLSEHTVSMRAACRHCLLLFQDLEPRLDEVKEAISEADSNVVEEALLCCSEHAQNREKALQNFWSERHDPDDPPDQKIPEFHYQARASTSEEQKQAQWFRQEFHNRNLPCLVTGLDESHFSFVNRYWRRNQGSDESSSSQSDNRSETAEREEEKT